MAGSSRGEVKHALGMVADPTTGVPARMARDRGPLADASRGRRSHSASNRLLTSPSIPGRRTPVYGSKTSGSPAEPEEWMMTTPSSSTSPSAWGSMFEHGSNSFRQTASASRRISRGSSSEISKGRMSILVIPRNSRATSRSPTSPCGITSVGSQSSATPFLVSSMQASSARSSLGQPTSPCSTSLAV